MEWIFLSWGIKFSLFWRRCSGSGITRFPLCGEGNCVLAGHNGSRRGVFFTNLGSAEVGMEVRLTTKEGVAHCYTVEEMRVVNPYDAWVTEESDTEVLTLFTCAEHGIRRFACRCVPVEDYGSERGNARRE